MGVQAQQVLGGCTGASTWVCMGWACTGVGVWVAKCLQGGMARMGVHTLGYTESNCAPIHMVGTSVCTHLGHVCTNLCVCAHRRALCVPL